MAQSESRDGGPAQPVLEQALCDSEESFRLLVESVLDYAIYMLDPDGHVISWNAGAQRLKGWRSEEILGRGVALFHPPDSVAAGRPREELRIARERGVFREEARRRRKDGSEFFADITLTALYDKDRRLRGFAKVTRDISERKLNEQRADEQAQDLRATNVELQSFAYSAAHDLRAPLRAMHGFSQALAEDYGPRLDDVGRDYLQRIAAAAKRMDDLIEGLLAYACIGRKDLPLNAVSLKAVAEIARDQNADLLVKKRGTVIIDQHLPVVKGNRIVLVQVLGNLIQNALKFTSGNTLPVARIWAEQTGSIVRTWVEDNGIGIAQENHARIFEVFQRVRGVTEYEGTGIGLAAVRKGIEHMGGTVGVESELGQGSRFWFELAKE